MSASSSHTTEVQDCPFKNCGCVYHAEEGILCDRAIAALSSEKTGSRNDVLEEAAKVCEESIPTGQLGKVAAQLCQGTGQALAHRIRALKNAAPQEIQPEAAAPREEAVAGLGIGKPAALVFPERDSPAVVAPSPKGNAERHALLHRIVQARTNWPDLNTSAWMLLKDCAEMISRDGTDERSKP